MMSQPQWDYQRGLMIVRTPCSYKQKIYRKTFDRTKRAENFVKKPLKYGGIPVIPKVRNSEGSSFPRFFIPKVRYSEGSLVRRFVIPKVH